MEDEKTLDENVIADEQGEAPIDAVNEEAKEGDALSDVSTEAKPELTEEERLAKEKKAPTRLPKRRGQSSRTFWKGASAKRWI